MAFINLRNISLAFGGPSLFEDISLRISKGERICLLGRNGTGKSTLLKVISGELPPDSGVIDRQQGLRVARLEQDVPRDLQGTIYEAIAEGLGQAGQLLSRYHNLSLRLEKGESLLHDELSEVQHQLENCDGWAHQQKVEHVISRLKLPGDRPVTGLSGGMMRRVLLAKALAVGPEVLLLDEPSMALGRLIIKDIFQLIAKLQADRKLTVLLIEQNANAALKIADRGYVIETGKIVLEEDAEKLMTNQEVKRAYLGREQKEIWE